MQHSRRRDGADDTAVPGPHHCPQQHSKDDPLALVKGGRFVPVELDDARRPFVGCRASGL
jgi:hypothetical protein